MTGKSGEVYTFPSSFAAQQELFRYQQYQKLKQIISSSDSSEAEFRIHNYFKNGFKKGTTYKSVLATVGEEFHSEGEFQQAGSFDLVSNEQTIMIRSFKLEDIQTHSDSVWYMEFAKPIYIENGEYHHKNYIERLIDERMKRD